MAETWLKPNRRALMLGMILPILISALGALAIWNSHDQLWLKIVGVALVLGGLLLVVVLVRSSISPRLAFDNGHLLLNLSVGRPIALPIDIVECFFLGTAEALLVDNKVSGTNVSTLIIRLAESAPDWKDRDVKQTLGKWCDGYITISGLWCEPLNVAKVNRLNARLLKVHRAVVNEPDSKSDQST